MTQVTLRGISKIIHKDFFGFWIFGFWRWDFSALGQKSPFLAVFWPKKLQKLFFSKTLVYDFRYTPKEHLCQILGQSEKNWLRCYTFRRKSNMGFLRKSPKSGKIWPKNGQKMVKNKNFSEKFCKSLNSIRIHVFVKF